VAAGDEHGDEEVRPRGGEQGQRRREGGPVDRRGGEREEDHGDWPFSASSFDSISSWPASVVAITLPLFGIGGDEPNERSVMAAGHAESTRSSARSGTITVSSAGRRSSAASETDGPGLRCSTAEISRSMYIAASPIAAAPTLAYPEPVRKTPARIANSPANAAEPGTASAITPVVISTVASAGLPRAIPPRPPSSPVVVRRSIAPARRKSVAEMRPWLTICSTAPLSPRSLTAKRPSVIRPSCARLE